MCTYQYNYKLYSVMASDQQGHAPRKLPRLTESFFMEHCPNLLIDRSGSATNGRLSTFMAVGMCWEARCPRLQFTSSVLHLQPSLSYFILIKIAILDYMQVNAALLTYFSIILRTDFPTSN